MNSGNRVAGRIVVAALALLLAAGGLAACKEQQAAKQVPVAINKDDTCFVCGMYITKYPGPRAEAYVRGRKTPLKFGSTRDFFAYVLQPENKASLQSLFVQDTAKLNWLHPSTAPASFVDARKAYYVAFQPLPGAMGPTLASFAKEADAKTFVAARGGTLLRFDQVTPELVSELATSCPPAGSDAAALAGNCVKGKAQAQ